MIFFGCDPGTSGAVAAVDWYGSPQGWIGGDCTDRDLLDFLARWSDEPRWAFLEEVGAKPRITPGGQRVSMGAKGAFTFGDSNGRLRMALVAAGVPFDKVLPAAWQAAMRCRTKGDKRVSKARAQELLPGEKITHRNADAYLLGLWCQRHHRDLDNQAAEAAEKG